MTGIYKITSLSGKVYIGQSYNIYQRWSQYKSLDPKTMGIKLLNSLKKYGYKEHIFEVIHSLPNDVDQSILYEYEILYWEQYKEANNMLNCKYPGKGGKLSEETKQRISVSSKGKSRNKGPKSVEHRKNMSLAKIGKKHSTEHVTNLKKGKIGKGTKSIICINDNMEFNSLIEASLYYNINPKCISNVLSGWAKKTKNKLIFNYK